MELSKCMFCLGYMLMPNISASYCRLGFVLVHSKQRKTKQYTCCMFFFFFSRCLYSINLAHLHLGFRLTWKLMVHISVWSCLYNFFVCGSQINGYSFPQYLVVTLFLLDGKQCIEGANTGATIFLESPATYVGLTCF